MHRLKMLIENCCNNDVGDSMKSDGKIIAFLLVGLAVLPGCLQVPVYKIKPLTDLHTHFSYSEIKNNIVFQVRQLADTEIEHLFDGRAIELLKSVTVLHCSIHNLSKTNYIFSVDNNHFSALSSNQIIRLLKTSSTGRIATGTFGGIGTAMTATGAFLGCLVLIEPMFLVAAPYAVIFGVPLVTTIFALPFFGKAIKSAVMNHRIKKDLNNKIITSNMLIPSGDVISGLMFIKSTDYTPEFSLMVHEQHNQTNKIVFDVIL
jgi:hypothetical protein